MKNIAIYLLFIPWFLLPMVSCVQQPIKPTSNIEDYIKEQMLQAKHYQTLGQHEKAIALLNKALPLAKQADAITYNAFLTHLGDMYLVTHQWEPATAYMIQAVNQAYESKNHELQAYTLNNLGNLLLLTGHYPQAGRAYASAMELIKIHQLNNQLAGQVLLNELRLHIKTTSKVDIFPKVSELQTMLSKLDEASKVSILLSSAQLLVQTYPQHYQVNHTLHPITYRWLEEALKLAAKQQDIYALSYAHMYLGQIYEQQQDDIKALLHNNQAIFYAQQQADHQSLYKAYWQKGRILKHQQQTLSAIHAYKQAIQLLTPLRQKMINEHRNPFNIFQSDIKPVYLEYINLLLSAQINQKPGEPSQAITTKREQLDEIKSTLEVLRTTELQDYFQDDCVVAAQAKVKNIEQIIDKQTAILYPIILEDRLVILASLHDGTYQYMEKISSQQLTQTVQQLRINLQTRAHNRFMQQAQQIYQWLFAGLQDKLNQAKIKTLIIVPDGVLRTIPFATLMNKDHFLIEQYSLAIVPSLSLTDTQPLSLATRKNETLIAGLSKAVQDFPPLPSVALEVNNLNQILKHSEIYQNTSFTLENLKKSFKKTPFTVVHMATHGFFGASAEESFLLTYDEKINMNQLEQLLNLTQFREDPVELLTLSACQTALGDERAALGLAGIAVKAGARSAVASLWFVDDEATSLLISEFYRQLQISHATKAQAMQAAQQYLLNQDRYWHPSYWGAFLLIGYWN